MVPDIHQSEQSELNSLYGVAKRKQRTQLLLVQLLAVIQVTRASE
jgi:hypothetical protein